MSSSLEFLPQLQAESSIHFRLRPAPLTSYRRLEWHLGVLALVINKCHGRRATVEQLHLLMWAVRSRSTREIFVNWWSGVDGNSATSARFDPHLEPILSVGIGDGLFERDGDRIKLTDRGDDLLSRLQTDNEILATEKEFLESVPGRISAAAMARLTG